MKNEITQRIIGGFSKEISAIHHANNLYWICAQGEPTRQARAEHQGRQDRLEEIRRKLSNLRSKVKSIKGNVSLGKSKVSTGRPESVSFHEKERPSRRG